MSMSAYDLIERGEYPQAAALLERAGRRTLEEQVAVQLLAVETSDAAAAHQSAKVLLDRGMTFRQRALCMLAISRACALTAKEQEALEAGKLAVELAGRTDDSCLLARAQARYTGVVLRCTGIEAALPELRRLRSYAFSAGDSAALIEFHCLVAEIETKQRRHHDAFAHLRTAQSLCDRDPHRRLQTQIFRLNANAALFSSRPNDAKNSARLAVQMAESSGGYLSLAACLSTLAHACLMSGALDDAEAALRRILALPGPEGGRLAAIDGLIQVALERRDHIEASRLVALVDEPGSNTSPSYYWLWHVPVRARWLMVQGSPADALSLLRRFSAPAKGTHDRQLQYRFRLAEAEAIAACGDPAAGASHLSAALSSEGVITLDGALKLNRIAAQLFRPDTTVARNLERRASRIHNFALAQNGVDESHDEAYASPFEFLHAAASFFTSPVDPQLVAYDAVALLQATGITDVKVEMLVPTDDTDVSPGQLAQRNEANATVSMECGQTFTTRYRVAAKLPSDVAPRLALSSVASLVRAAATLAASETRKATEVALWPQDTPENHIGMVVAAANMNELLNVTRRVATSTVTVLFTGETGTGKELLARALHDASRRREKPFIPFNCTAVPRDMLDSQLFGYRRGAFTGAQEAFQGVIRAAAGGTLFLDEVGELPLDVQPKLLRFLESGEIHPLGEPRPSNVDVRVVAATNADLEQLVAAGRFRQDLFYRLNVVRLPVPPLRERREEIPLIAQHYIDLFSREAQKTGIRLAEETMEYLVLYRWPGNVRQLANQIRRMVALAESGAILMPEHLSREIAASRRTIPASERDLAPTEFVVRMDQPMSAAIEHLERSMIQYAMTRAEGRQENAAHLLGLSRKGLYLKRARLKMAGALDSEAEEALEESETTGNGAA
jgi:DNA-binding NtrC family response regulator